MNAHKNLKCHKWYNQTNNLLIPIEKTISPRERAGNKHRDRLAVEEFPSRQEQLTFGIRPWFITPSSGETDVKLTPDCSKQSSSHWIHNLKDFKLD